MKGSARVIVLAMVIVTVGFVLKFAEEGASEENLFVIHQDLSKTTMKDCVSCHDVLNEKSLDRNIKTAHVIHAFFGKDGCLFCHQDSDINQDSGDLLRKHVDVKICLGCHVSTEKGWEASMSSTQE